MIKIIEAVLASIVLLSTLTFFFGMGPFHSNWGDSFTKLKAQDSLMVLEKNDNLSEIIREGDSEQLRKVLGHATEEQVVYSLNINGLAPPKIGVFSPRDNKASMLLNPGDFDLQGRNVSITVASENYTSSDVIFLFNSSKAKQYEDFIKEGNGLVIVDNMTNNTVVDDVNDLVGENFTSFEGSEETQFMGETQPENISFRIHNYFFDTPFMMKSGEFNVSEVGDDNITLESGEVVFKGDNYVYDGWNLSLRGCQGNEAYLEVDQVSDFKLKAGLESNSYCILGKGDGCSMVAGSLGKGRFVWVNDYHSLKKVNDALLKAGVLWATGESYKLIPGEFQEARLGGKYFSIPIFMSGINPYTIELKVGRIFI